MSLDQYIKDKVHDMGLKDLKSLKEYVEQRINDMATFDENDFTMYLDALSQERLEEMLDTVNLMTRKKHTPTGVFTREYEPFEKFLNACSEEQLVTIEMCIDGMLDSCDGPCELESDESESDDEYEEFMKEEHSQEKFTEKYPNLLKQFTVKKWSWEQDRHVISDFDEFNTKAKVILEIGDWNFEFSFEDEMHEDHYSVTSVEWEIRSIKNRDDLCTVSFIPYNGGVEYNDYTNDVSEVFDNINDFEDCNYTYKYSIRYGFGSLYKALLKFFTDGRDLKKI